MEGKRKRGHPSFEIDDDVLRVCPKDNESSTDSVLEPSAHDTKRFKTDASQLGVKDVNEGCTHLLQTHCLSTNTVFSANKYRKLNVTF